MKGASSPGSSAAGSPAAGRREAADFGDDSKMIYAQKRATRGYGAEIRKQLKRKQEIEDINKNSVQK